MRTGLMASVHKRVMKNKDSRQGVLEKVWIKFLDVPHFLSVCSGHCAIKKMLAPGCFNKHLSEVSEEHLYFQYVLSAFRE